MREARPDLYRAGVFRKYLLVVTDGENTHGREPRAMSRARSGGKSEGAVQVYFVAFDTSPEKFAFLKDVGGDVIGAGTGAELRTALDGIYTRARSSPRRSTPASGNLPRSNLVVLRVKGAPVILHKFWSAFVAQINKVANIFWEADPVAQMRYEYDRAVEQLKEGRVGLEQYRGLVERVTRQVVGQPLARAAARGADQGVPEGRRSHHGGEVRAARCRRRRGSSQPTRRSCRCTRRRTATA